MLVLSCLVIRDHYNVGFPKSR